MTGMDIVAGIDAQSPSSTASSAPSADTLRDLGNLIQVAASALNIMSRSPETSSTLKPIISEARASLQRAGDILKRSGPPIPSHIRSE